MPSAHIANYTAHVGRLGELGSDRLIVVTHTLVAGDDPQQAASEIYFADRFGESQVGYSTLGTANRVRAHLPAADYAAWIDLLRHEDPVYLHWSVAEDPERADPEGIIHLATGPEPTGEGPVDLSP